MITTNAYGDVFVEFCAVPEESLATLKLDAPLTHALAGVEYDGKFLLMFNRFRQVWELPGGIIEPGETPRSCVLREIDEETAQEPNLLFFRGLMKFQLHPDSRIEYGALFFARLDTLKPFEENSEAERIILWDRNTPIGEIDSIDRTLIEFARKT